MKTKSEDIPLWVREELNEELINNISKDSVKKAVMNTKMALEILMFLAVPGRKVGLHWNVREVWYKVFPFERMPTDNLHNIPAEQSISYETVKEKLLMAAIDYLAQKIDK